MIELTSEEIASIESPLKVYIPSSLHSDHLKVKPRIPPQQKPLGTIPTAELIDHIHRCISSSKLRSKNTFSQNPRLIIELKQKLYKIFKNTVTPNSSSIFTNRGKWAHFNRSGRSYLHVGFLQDDFIMPYPTYENSVLHAILDTPLEETRIDRQVTFLIVRIYHLYKTVYLSGHLLNSTDAEEQDNLYSIIKDLDDLREDLWEQLDKRSGSDTFMCDKKEPQIVELTAPTYTFSFDPITY